MKTKKYIFYKHPIEIIDGTIEVETDGITLHPDDMTIDVTILYRMKTPKGEKTDTERIYGVPVQNMNFEPNSLNARTFAKLKDFIAK